MMKCITEHLYESISYKPARIFIIVKPGFLDCAKDILLKFKEEGWEIEQSRTKTLLEPEARRLYSIHKNEDWFAPLCKYMSSSPSQAYIMVNHDKQMSKDIFDEVAKIKDDIRKEYGESDMRNVLHSSDSGEHMAQESIIYFPYFHA